MCRTKHNCVYSQYTSVEMSVSTGSYCLDFQEEYEDGDELGKVDCGHSYHVLCIQQWLVQKNQCPICKAPAFAQLIIVGRNLFILLPWLLLCLEEQPKSASLSHEEVCKGMFAPFVARTFHLSQASSLHLEQIVGHCRRNFHPVLQC